MTTNEIAMLKQLKLQDELVKAQTALQNTLTAISIKFDNPIHNVDVTNADLLLTLTPHIQTLLTSLLTTTQAQIKTLAANIAAEV